MSNVLIVVDSSENNSQADGSGSFAAEIGIALKQAILATFPPVTHAGKQQVKAESPEAAALPAFSVQVPKVQIVTLTDLEKQRSSIVASLDNLIICPLTLNVPDWLPFPGQGVYYQCRNIGRLRSQVEEWDYGTGSGNLWLAIALTAKGPLYAEAIGLSSQQLTQAKSSVPGYIQPIHLTDELRKPLYALGFRLLRLLAASPAVYLMQFGIQAEAIYFDRLIPFPAAPAIASPGVQVPDLFTCYWYCITGRAIRDLIIQVPPPEL